MHSARKSIKRVRTTLRLSRDAIGDKLYDRENLHLRMIAGRLAGARDARVMVDTLDGLAARFEDQLPEPAIAALRARLEDHERAVAEMAADGELRKYVEVHPQLFGDTASRDALLAVLDRRSGALQRCALKLGRRLYKRSPKRFVARIRGGWEARAGTPARAVAG